MSGEVPRLSGLAFGAPFADRRLVTTYSSVMPGPAEGRVPGIHVLQRARRETWIAGTSPGHDDLWWYGRPSAAAAERAGAGTLA